MTTAFVRPFGSKAHESLEDSRQIAVREPPNQGGVRQFPRFSQAC